MKDREVDEERKGAVEAPFQGSPAYPAASEESTLEATIAAPRQRREFTGLSKADEVRLFPEKFRHDMLWLDIWGLPLPLLAFALTHREDVDVTCPEVRDAIARVNCVEGGTWGKGAQALLTPTVSAFGPQKPKSKRKGGRRGPEREPDWSPVEPVRAVGAARRGRQPLRGRHVHAVRRGLSHPPLARGGAVLPRLRPCLFDAGRSARCCPADDASF